MMRALVPAFAALAALLAACSQGADAPPGRQPPTVASTAEPASCAPARAQMPGDYAFTLPGDGGERAYYLHVPPTYDGATATPLVLAFPASELSADAFAGFAGLPAGSDRDGYLLAILEVEEGADSWSSGGDGVAYAGDVLNAVSHALCVDGSRVYVTGYSDGGGMAQALACERPDRVAALAVVASTYLSCRAPVPMIAFHGLADTIVPFEGSEATGAATESFFPNVRRAISEWARGLGCDALATISRPSPEVELSTYRRCAGGDGEALLYSIIGGGHTWPGHPSGIERLGATTTQIDATAAIWAFFSVHALASQTAWCPCAP
jgi:polyhydroxybutyrate depolymerase